MKPQSKSPVLWNDLIRRVVYETLPYLTVACLWVVAWSRSLESKVQMILEPHYQLSTIFPTDQSQASATDQPVAAADQN